jgi:hypothetical protein
MPDWVGAFEELFIKKSGEHGIVGGPTGTGKTQVLYHIVDGITHLHKNEAIAWMDVGKSGEPLRLMDFRPITFYIPYGCEIRIEFSSPAMEEKYKGRYEVKHYQDKNYEDLIRQFERDRINVMEIKPFIREPDEYAERVSLFFRTLINMAMDHKLRRISPLAIFIDEMHWVAPGQGHALNDVHNDAGKWMQMNIDTLRSMKVRLIGATQNWTKIRRGVRQAFGFIFIKRGLAFSKTDEWRLSKYNGTFERIQKSQTIMALPLRNFSDLMPFPFYGDGSEIGEIYYLNSPLGLHTASSQESHPDMSGVKASP